MAFPPRTADELGDLRRSGPPFALDPAIVERVYEAAWYLLPGPAPAFAATTWTFEVATTRLDALPSNDAVLPWLVAIADRESRRHRSINQWARRKNQRYTDAQDPTARALHLAEAIGRIDPDNRLALVLRHLLHASDEHAGAALGIRAAQVNEFVKTSEIHLADHTKVAARVLGQLPPPASLQSLSSVTPMQRTQSRRSKLNYGWQSDGFPTKTAYDNQTQRRVMTAGAMAAVAAALVIGFNQLEPLRPTLQQPAAAADAHIDVPTSGSATTTSAAPPTTTTPPEASAAPVTTGPPEASADGPGFVFPDLSGASAPTTTAPTGLVFPDLSGASASTTTAPTGLVFPDLSDVLTEESGTEA